MTSAYREFRENTARHPDAPCHMAPPLALDWSVQYNYIVQELPLIDDGLAFFSNADGTLVAAREDGEEVWTRPNCARPSFISDGVLFVYNEKYAVEWIDARTGALLRKAPSIAGMRAGTVGGTILTHSFEDHHVFRATNLETGAIRWEIPFPAKRRISTVFCASESAMFLGLDDGSVHAFATKNGKEIWRQSVAHLTWNDLGQTRPGRPQGVATLWKDRVLIDSRSHVSAFASDTGEHLWTTDVDYVGASYLYDDLYYTVGGFVIDPADGRILDFLKLYQKMPPKLQQSALSPPLLVSETHIFTTTLHGHILAFDRRTGEFVSQFRPRGWGPIQMHSYFMSVNRRFYYVDLSMRLYCLKESGKGKK